MSASLHNRSIKLLAALIALCLAVIPAREASAQAKNWGASYFRGLQALKNRNWNQAINQLSSAINSHPESRSEVQIPGWQTFDYYPYLYRGIAYFQSGDKQKAKQDIEHENDTGEVPRGTRDTRAAELLKQFLPLVREQKRPAPFVEGMQLFNQKDYRGAMEAFGRVPPTSPRYDEAKNFITLAQDEIRKAEQAAASEKAQKARRAEAQKPKVPAVDTSGQALFRDALALFNAGRLRAARAKFQELDARGFQNPDVDKDLTAIAAVEEKTLMGVTAFLEGDYTLAVGQLSECAKSQSDNPHLYAFLAYSCAAKYLLAARQDTSLSRQAHDAYSHLQSVAPSYTPDARFVSPGIVAFLKGESSK